MQHYSRKTPVLAIQFSSVEFHKDPLKFISVFDKATFSATWASKTAEDGRYYIMNQTNTSPFNSSTEVGEGDYIVHDDGHHFVFPKDTFERNFQTISYNESEVE